MARFSLHGLISLSILFLPLVVATLPRTSEAARGWELRASSDDEIVQEFKKYFRKFTDRATRIEAIYSLQGTDSPSVARVLAPILADEDSEVVDAAVKVLATFKESASINTLFTLLEEEKKEPIRLGILRAITVGGFMAESEALVECLDDKSWMVRYRAIQALQSRNQRSSIPKMIELTRDKESAVRCASIEALAAMRETTIVDIAIAALQDDIWQVRSSAAGALRDVRDIRSIEPLIARMETEQGRLLYDYSRALEEITAKGFGMRTEMWRDWWTGIANRFVIPTDAELAAAKAKRAENLARYTPPGSTNYHGIETPSRSVLFIIDVSGSMENHVVETERFKDGDYPSMSRIDIVKTELARTIEGLDSYVKFNILSFATDVKSWKKKLVPCNVLNQRSAMDYALKLEAIGGNSKEDLARAGLTGTANLEAGKTNTYGVLMEALGVAGRGTRDKAYDVEVDTIFFLSDGRPTVGELIDPNDILEEVRIANELRKVVIHTIALGEFQKEFMRTLASENGGVFVDLGK